MIVYFSFPAHGHVYPTLPVMRELARRGERISYYGAQLFAAAIGATGARFCAYSRRLRMPERGPGAFAQVSTTVETLLDFTEAVLEEHLGEVRALEPTLVMFDSFAPWGRLVAHRLGLASMASVPSILVNDAIDARYGRGPGECDPRLTREWYGAMRARCQALWKELAPRDLLQSYGDWNLVYTSRAFQPRAEDFDERRFCFVGPCCDFRPDPPDFPFDRLDGRPLVLVAMGTVYGRADFLNGCMEELADGPWQVVVAAGDGELAPAPANVLVQQRVPQIELLRRASAFVTHGGMNSVQEALSHGVPLVLAPQAADQFWIAARAVELGVGRMAENGIRASVAEVLADADYRQRAAQIGRTLRAAGGSRRAAHEIQRFAHSCMPCDDICLAGAH